MHPWTATVASVVGVTLGMVLSWSVWRYAEVTAPVTPRLVDVPIVSVGASGTRFIRTHVVSASPQRCTRQATFLMYRDDLGARRTYFTINSTTSGAGLQGSVYDFDTLWALPADFPAGKWTMIVRFVHMCPPAGLIHWFDTTAPIEVEMP